MEYYFVSNEILEQYGEEGKIIELRTYQTVYGDWKYATIDDGQIHLTGSDYLMIGTLESYMKMKRIMDRRIWFHFILKWKTGNA